MFKHGSIMEITHFLLLKIINGLLAWLTIELQVILKSGEKLLLLVCLEEVDGMDVLALRQHKERLSEFEKEKAPHLECLTYRYRGTTADPDELRSEKEKEFVKRDPIRN